MPARKDRETFIEELKKVNPKIKVLGDYVNNNVPIECECKVCKHRWSPRPSNLLHGYGCPKCGKRAAAAKRRKGQEEFVREVAKVSPNVEILGEYKNSNSSIKTKCLLCGRVWNAHAGALLKGSGCRVCAQKETTKKQTKSHEQFVQEMMDINPNIEILGRYTRSKDKVHCKCRVCGYEWNPIASNLLHGYGCVRCAKREPNSKLLLEKDIVFLRISAYNLCRGCISAHK